MVVVSLSLGAPLLVLLSSWLMPWSELWGHVLEVLLPEYLYNTLVLTALILPGCWIIGIFSAWLVTHYQWYGSKLIEWLLVLPLAVPAFVITYTYTSVASVAGQQSIDPIALLVSFFFSQANNHIQLGVLMSLVLYPYVYLSARVAFYNQNPHLQESARLGNWSRLRRFTKISLPLARPMIIAGSALVLMHILSEYASFNMMGMDTISTGVYRIWFGHAELKTATQLAVLLLIIMCAIMVIEKKSRGRMRFFFYSSRSIKKRHLSAYQAIIASVLLLIPFFLGFLYPNWVLMTWWFDHQRFLTDDFLSLMGNTLFLGIGTSFFILPFVFLLAYCARYLNQTKASLLLHLVRLGAVMPGTVLAASIASLAVFLERYLHLEGAGSYLLTGTLFGLFFAYCVRFLPIGMHQAEASMSRIKAHLDETCSLMSMSLLRRLRMIHIPLMRRSAMMILLLIFLEVVKEMPMTQVLRPVEFNTLAIRIMEFVSDERLDDAAPYALVLALIGVIPVILLVRMTDDRIFSKS